MTTSWPAAATQMRIRVKVSPATDFKILVCSELPLCCGKTGKVMEIENVQGSQEKCRNSGIFLFKKW